MKQQRTILTVIEFKDGQYVRQHIRSFEERFQVKNYIKEFLGAEADALGTNVPDEVAARDFAGALWGKDPAGEIRVEIGRHAYVFAFLHEPGSYQVSNEEVVSVLESFVNSNHSVSTYASVADTIAVEMHRYLQNELWRFVRCLIAAFAMMRSDERNRIAQREAAEVFDFIQKKF